MPRLHTKRGNPWGTGFTLIKGRFVERDLDRECRSNKWRKDRNGRRKLRKIAARRML